MILAIHNGIIRASRIMIGILNLVFLLKISKIKTVMEIIRMTDEITLRLFTEVANFCPKDTLCTSPSVIKLFIITPFV